MWEINIKTCLKNNTYIANLHNILQPALKKADAIVAFDESKSSVSIGCADDKSKQLWQKTKLALCEIFCIDFKRDFLKQNIIVSENMQGYYDAFIKVLTYFDTELEKQIVMRVLNYSKTIVLESYLNFKLMPLKQKWKELCLITSTNNKLFLKSETFLELLKFLISNIEPKSDCVIVSFKAPCMVFKERKNNMVAVDAFENVDEFELVSQLIELAPMHIKIVPDSNKNPTVRLIQELFAGKTEMIEN